MSKKYFSLIIFTLIQVVAYSHVFPINKKGNIKTLKYALELANDGDTLVMSKGVYEEYEIKIDKSIHLIGEKGAVIDCKMNKGITILADSVTIENMTIKNIGISFTEDLAAIKVKKGHDFKIINNTFRNVFFGIFIEKSKNGIIKGNDIKSNAKTEFNSGNGIHLWYCKNIDIINNKVTNLRDGIYLEFVSKSRITNNVSKNNLRYGLHFMFSNNDEYSNNWFENNGAGVAVMFSKHIIMNGNTFYKNWGSASYGLLLKEINDAEIYNNTFEENTIGINAEGSNRVKYNNNNFISNGWAIKVRGACYKNHFRKNNFLSNTFDVSYKGRMNDNLFEGNYWSEYTGYDLDKNGVGDIPYRPVKLFSYVVNKTPETIILLRSLFVDIINFSEKVSPIFTPDNLIDPYPLTKKIQ